VAKPADLAGLVTQDV